MVDEVDTGEDTLSATIDPTATDGTETVDPDEAATLEKRVADRRAYLEQSQKELTQTRQELAALKAVREELARQKEPDKGAEDPFAGIFSENLSEEVSEDPGVMVGVLQKTLQSIGNLLQQRDTALSSTLESKVQQLIEQATSPEAALLKDTPLKGQAWFDSLSHPAKVEAAKAFANSSGKPLKPPATSPAGTRRGATDDSTPDKRKAAAEASAAAMGPLAGMEEAKDTLLGIAGITA